MSLDFAAGHFRDAVVTLATSDQPMQARLQQAWIDHVQMVWMKRCLTRDLLRDFKDLWETYTAPSDDPRSTTLRDLTDDELAAAVVTIVDLATRTAGAASQDDSEALPLATLADLD